LHPLATRLRSCDSSDAILSVLQEQAQAIDPSWNGDEKLAMWLGQSVDVLYALSSSLEEGVGLVSSPAKVIFVGISILLSAAHSVHANQDGLINIFRRMDNLFQRLRAYTVVPPPQSSKDLNEEIMLTVLSILTSVTEEITQGRARKYLKKFVGRNVVEDALRRLDELTLEEAQMETAARGSFTGERTTPHNGQEPRVTTPRISDDVGDPSRPPTSSASANGGSNTAPRHRLLEQVEIWLSPPDPSTNHNVACQARHEGTASWFMQDDVFRQWKSTGSLLWVHGKPGSGKSVLCSAIIEDINVMRETEVASMAYFYFDFKDNYKQSRLDVIPSLLTQLSAQSKRCRDILSCLYSAHNRGAQMPTGDVLTKCLKDMLSLPGQSPVYIILDAIDECPDIPGVPSPREDALELLKELIELRLPNLRLCVTSRPEIGIRAVLEPLLSHRVSLHDENGQKKDIEDYISSVVGLDRKFERWREEDKCLVIKTLSERAGGMFRWVSCQLDRLRQCLPPSVRRILDELPEGLDETYERILMEINVASRKHARRLLQCLTVASQPLRVDELAEVLAVDFDADGTIPKLNVDWRWEDQERAVLSTCSSLVEVITTDDSKFVQFSHHSVKEFLTSDRLAASSGRISFYHILHEPAHTILARACLSVLLRLDDQINKDTIKGFPLAEYAARHWLEHAQFRNVALHIQNGMEALFDPSGPHFAAWVWVYDIDETPGPPMTHPTQPQAGALYYSALCGFPRLVEHLIVDRGVDVNARGGRHGTPLHAALCKGHVPIARLLINNGADVNALDDEDSSPLHMALYFGYFEVVPLLLRKGADANVQHNRHSWSTPLHIASCSSHSNVVRSLLESGAEVNVRDDKGRTPLHIASDNGNSNAVRLLLEYYADVTSRDNKDSTPLHLVSIKGNLEIVKLLVEHRADINTRDDKMSTPLHFALTNGNQKVAEFLIEHNADVDAEDNKKSTPLHLASLNGNFDLVKLLLEHKAGVNARDNRLRTPLHLASYSGSIKPVELLIERGADVDAKDATHSTPLHVASRRGPSEVVKCLIEHGAMPDVQNDKGWTPLHLATQEGAFDVAQCLLTRGADANVADGYRRTPLHEASKNDNLKLVRLLIEHGANPYAQDNRKQIPINLRPVVGGKRKV
jgi:ankyrin repeat protein